MPSTIRFVADGEDIATVGNVRLAGCALPSIICFKGDTWEILDEPDTAVLSVYPHPHCRTLVMACTGEEASQALESKVVMAAHGSMASPRPASSPTQPSKPKLFAGLR